MVGCEDMPIYNEKAYELAQVLTKLLCHMKPKKIMSDVNPSQMMVIMAITFNCKEKGYVTPSMISEELGLSKSALTAILNSLEEKKYIERELSKEDRRMIMLKLTEKSVALHEEYHSKVNSSILNLANYLGEEDTEKFIQLITKANNFLNK
jgi:DNA-binding MarR family transcriptional regulator